MTKKTYALGTVVWFAAGLYYLYQYILRVSPMVMVDSIRLDFDLNASAFGSLMAVTTFFYAAMQIPMGVLSDLFGVRRMVLTSLVACTLGIGLFGYTESLWIAYVARILIGLGSAAAFVCVSKVSSEWFPVRQKTAWFAATVVMGNTGAVIGGKSLAQMVGNYGWRESLMILTGIGVIVLIVNGLLLWNRSDKTKLSQGLPSQEETPASMDRHQLWNQIKHVFASRSSWLYALVAMGMYLPISVFTDLWGVPFFQEKFNVDREAAAHAISISYYGTSAGVIALALVIQYIGNSRSVIRWSAFMIFLLMAVLSFADGLNVFTASLTMFFIGFFAGGEVLCFSESCKHMSIYVAATVTGFLNFIITIGGAGVQKIFGSALDWFWAGHATPTGSRLYTLPDYQWALLIVVTLTFLSFLLSFCLPPDLQDEQYAAPK